MSPRFTKALGCAALAVLGAAVTLGVAGPAAADNSGALYGNPDGAAPYWVQQSLDDCALMSVADVVGQVTGHQPSEEEIVAVANSIPSANHDGPVYTPPQDPNDPNSGWGTNNADVPILLKHYGIDASYTDESEAPAVGIATGMDALEQYLSQGRKVIAFVNAETIWDADGDRTAPDHALVVTGVDADQGIVHLNDSGTDNGCDEQVPVDSFAQAWATSTDAMVVTA